MEQRGVWGYEKAAGYVGGHACGCGLVDGLVEHGIEGCGIEMCEIEG